MKCNLLLPQSFWQWMNCTQQHCHPKSSYVEPSTNCRAHHDWDHQFKPSHYQCTFHMFEPHAIDSTAMPHIESLHINKHVKTTPDVNSSSCIMPMVPTNVSNLCGTTALKVDIYANAFWCVINTFCLSHHWPILGSQLCQMILLMRLRLLITQGQGCWWAPYHYIPIVSGMLMPYFQHTQCNISTWQYLHIDPETVDFYITIMSFGSICLPFWQVTLLANITGMLWHWDAANNTCLAIGCAAWCLSSQFCSWYHDSCF